MSFIPGDREILISPDIVKSIRNITFKMLTSNCLCRSASVEVVISEINRTVEELMKNIDKI